MSQNLSGKRALAYASLHLFDVRQKTIRDLYLSCNTSSLAAAQKPSKEPNMTSKLDELLPKAGDYMKKIALAEAEEASKEAAKMAAAEAEKQALIDRLTKPSGVSDEEAIQRAVRIIERAVANGKTEVQVYRFPNVICTDKGRAINQQERGWEDTLTGVPKEIHQLWAKYFRDRGYKLRVEIIDFPGGMPGDVAMTLMWS
jgi:hypothetical protein